MAKPNQIFWPIGFEPKKVPIHVHNELLISTLPEVVWAWLTPAQPWPTWCPNSANIQFLNSQPPNLALGTRFGWKTFGLTIVSTVIEFVPFEHLAWDAHGNGLDAYNAWLIQKTEQGCIL